MVKWNPNQYQKFINERNMPIKDLLNRLDINLKCICDLGSGSSNSTNTLKEEIEKNYKIHSNNLAILKMPRLFMITKKK